MEVIKLKPRGRVIRSSPTGQTEQPIKQTPNTLKVLGVCLIGASACPVGLDIITLPLGFSLMTSTNRKQIIPNFTFIFSSNLKKIKKGLNKLYNLRYNKLGIRRF